MEKAYRYVDKKDDRLSFFIFSRKNQIIKVPFFNGDGNSHKVLPSESIDITEKEPSLYENTKINNEITYLNVGEIINSVWRPGLYYSENSLVSLGVKDEQLARSKRDLKLLIKKLDDILLYIEPDEEYLNVYSHKLRELLILACTEVENSWIYYMKLSGKYEENYVFKTRDYVKLCAPLYLKEYSIKFTRYPFEMSFSPFLNWDEGAPTASLSWYDDYNSTKHQKDAFFGRANLKNCLNALAANIILFAVRFHPDSLEKETDDCSNLINEHFKIELNNPNYQSFYIPPVIIENHCSGCFTGPDSISIAPWTTHTFYIDNSHQNS